MATGDRRRGRGRVRAAGVGPAHAEGFNRALQKALDNLPNPRSEKYEVRFFVVVQPNPGDVGEYVVELG